MPYQRIDPNDARRRRTGVEPLLGAITGIVLGVASAVVLMVVFLATRAGGGQGMAGMEAIAGCGFWSFIFGGVGGVVGLIVGTLVWSRRAPGDKS